MAWIFLNSVAIPLNEYECRLLQVRGSYLVPYWDAIRPSEYK